MFSAWDLHSWVVSVGTALFMISFVTAFGAFVATLIARILGEERDVAEPSPTSRSAKEPSFREAA